MKTSNFVFLLFFSLLFLNNSIAQHNFFTFKFKIWKNNTYVGVYTLTTSSGGSNTYGTVNNPVIDLCPGDQLTLENLCENHISPHSFNGNVMGPGGSNPFGELTIGLTSQNHCSNPNSTSNSIQHLADVTNGPGYASQLATYKKWSSWGYGFKKTVTVPNSASRSHLIISAKMLSNTIPHCNCGDRYYFIPIRINPVNAILDKIICPGDVVNLGLDPDHTYSNWSPSNPDGTSPTSTQEYSVNITNTSGCSINHTFKINVQNPTKELINKTTLCYNESIQITQNDFWDLFAGNTFPKEIYINGVLVAELGALNNLPQTINSATYGAGVVTVKYIYEINSQTCSKTYEITILPEIEINPQKVYRVCNRNFQQLICATPSSSPQPGVHYEWYFNPQSLFGGFIGANPCILPHDYGTYHLTATNDFGCRVESEFKVTNGLGIAPPKDVTYCSLVGNPSYIGWPHDPFLDIDLLDPIGVTLPSSVLWMYTAEGSNQPVLFATTGIQYQVPFVGPGTYSVTITAANCTETFTITVTDLLTTYTNAPNATFSISPAGSLVTCMPNSSIFIGQDSWTVVDQHGNTIPTHPYNYGIQFPYTQYTNYTITLRRESPEDCAIFTNSHTWMDNGNFYEESASFRSDNNSEHSDLELPSNVHITVTPNPFTTFTTINIDHYTGKDPIVFELYNLLGERVETMTSNKTQFELKRQQLTAGIYTYQVKAAQQLLGSGKIVLQ